TTRIVSVNPATEEVLASFDPFTPDEIDGALAEVDDAFRVWRERPLDERAVPMRRLASLLRDRSERYARLITIEMGKPITEAKGEIEKCAWACEHFAEHAKRYLADMVIPSNATRSLVAFEPIIADDRIRAVTLTGSSDTGSRIAELAGRALKKTVLELGGSDPFIVLADADLDAATATAVRARNQNAGQSCIAAKRFIVERGVAESFERAFAKAVESLAIGDPLDARTQ